MSNVASKTNTESDTNVQVDEGFIKVMTNLDVLTEQMGGKWASVCRYVIKHNLSREVVLASLKKMGKKYETMQSTATRIFDLCKPENQWKLDKMETKELSVRESRNKNIKLVDGKIVRHPTVERPASVRIAEHLQKAAGIAFTEEFELVEFLEEATKAFESAAKKSTKKAEKPTEKPTEKVAA